MAKVRRVFTAEFKAEAVRRVTEGGKSLAEVARELDPGESLLRSRKQARATKGDQAFPGKGNLPPVEEELRRLRAENQRLRAEREISRKATAFFGSCPPDGEPLGAEVHSARDDNGGGVREVRCNTQEGIWTHVRAFLRRSCGVSKWYLARSEAVFRWGYNIKFLTDEFLKILLGRPPSTDSVT